MAKKRIPGLTKRGDVWHINKQISGRRICQSTGESSLDKAEEFLARLIDQTRQARIYGTRPKWTFEQGATRYLETNLHKRSISDCAERLTVMHELNPRLFPCALDSLYGELEIMKQAALRTPMKNGLKRSVGTVNHYLKIVRRICNLATEWRDEHGLTWLQHAPKIKLLPDTNKRPPYPLSWDEQDRIFRRLPKHVNEMALFAVNTGCRENEVVTLQWRDEVKIPELGTSVFVVPASRVKNKDDRLIVLNRVAKSVIDARRGIHPEFVFTFHGKPLGRINATGWHDARKAAGLKHVRVHDLKHTFGRRLRAAGVSLEDRQDLLGHRSGRITTHYSAPELTRLLDAANKVCESSDRRPELVVIRRLNIG